jgi:hypothetical protein
VVAQVLGAWRTITVEGLPVRHGLDFELRARRHYRRALCVRVLWGWKRVAHHAHLNEVRWVNRGGRRVALKRDVAQVCRPPPERPNLDATGE